jgi:RNA polymerase sigma-70 factor (ECF subfamily)
MDDHPPDSGSSGSGPSDSDTVALTRRARAGDRAAFQQLYERIAPSLYAWLRLRMAGGPGTRDQAQDILQEVWLRAVRGIHGFQSPGSFRSWVFGIAKNVLLQSFRNAAREPTRGFLAAPSGRDLEIPDSVTSISLRLAKDDAVRRFLAYVEQLPAEDSRLVVYCGLEGYTAREAAQRLGIEPDAARKRWQALRERMNGNGTLQALALGE